MLRTDFSALLNSSNILAHSEWNSRRSYKVTLHNSLTCTTALGSFLKTTYRHQFPITWGYCGLYKVSPESPDCNTDAEHLFLTHNIYIIPGKYNKWNNQHFDLICMTVMNYSVIDNITFWQCLAVSTSVHAITRSTSETHGMKILSFHTIHARNHRSQLFTTFSSSFQQIITHDLPEKTRAS